MSDPGISIWPEAMVTAHRKLPRGAATWLEEVLPQKISKLRDDCGTERVTSGMATGGDQLFARAAQNLRMPLRAAIPYPGQPLDGTDGYFGPKWTRQQRATWEELCTYARGTGGLEHVYEHNPRTFGERVHMLHKRNDWMLQRSTVVLALWEPIKDGRINSIGGTYNCIVKAASAGMPVILFDLTARTITMPTSAQWAERLGIGELAASRGLW